MNTAENPHAGQGMVVLDIGGDIGALVIAAAPSMAGTEIEICPAGMRSQPPDNGGDWWHGQWHTHPHGAAGSSHHAAWPHVAVVGRPSAKGVTYAAVYPGLRDGSYEVWQRPDGPTVLTVDVQGATIAEASWPAAPA
jgi:hypothetical protein